MFLIILAVVGSLVFLAITAAIAKSGSGAGRVALFCVVAAFCSLGALPMLLSLFSPLWIFQSVLTLLAALACAGLRAKPTTMVRAFVAVTVVSFGLAIVVSVSAFRNYESLREHFPVESVADRLAYEGKSIGEGVAVPSSPVLSSQIEKRLTEIEKRGSSTFRQYMLHRLHDQQSSDFVAARGFGIGRMMVPTEMSIKLPQAEPVPLPQKQEHPYVPDGTPDPLTDGNASAAVAGQHPFDLPRPDKGELDSMFASSLNDFLDPERIGYVQDRDHVVGFVSHRFTSLPTPKAEWQIVRLELVSLLKHEVPVAYLSEHLPQMDELRDAPTRPLDDFERQALERLRSDDDLVIDDDVHRIRMVGSLRAGKNCLECHSVQRGELLGAFSYELVPTCPMPIKDRERKRSEPDA